MTTFRRLYRTPAFDQFVASLSHGHEGYDTAALAGMTATERDHVVRLLTIDDHAVGWREIQVLAAVDSPAARRAVEEALSHHLSVDARLAAAESMYDADRLHDIEPILCRQIRELHRVEDGLDRALRLAERHDSLAVRQALLYAAYNRTPCAPHCAALVCFLCGETKSRYAASHDTLFRQLDAGNSYFVRKAAFDALCRLVGMTYDASQF
jgi:hypothetical protein